jgi:molybdopterin molybdotransferase
MKPFFQVTTIDKVLEYRSLFNPVGIETVPLEEADGRVLAEPPAADGPLPDFPRTTMDGYAVRAASTFGASESSPGYFIVRGTIPMGVSPDFTIGPGEAARIATGGMLPEGTDAVVMIEHTDALDDETIEVYRSVAPGQHVIQVGEDVAEGAVLLESGRRIGPAEAGLLAAFGKERVTVFKPPAVGIVSTGDEVVPVGETPGRGQIRDVNTYTLAAMVRAAGGRPRTYGIIADDYETLRATVERAVSETDMVLVSGGSSVGTRDYTVEALSALSGARLLAHGISISPGKPTILAAVGQVPFWGLPGHVVSAMVVFAVVVRPFLHRLAGADDGKRFHHRWQARMTRNVASAQGRVDYVRVRLKDENGEIWADPVLGKSGLIHTMVAADGLVAIDMNSEGLDKGSAVSVIPLLER